MCVNIKKLIKALAIKKPAGDLGDHFFINSLYISELF